MARTGYPRHRGHAGEIRSEGQCVHYWIIEMPEGPSSKGTCRKCGAVAEFKNYLVFSSWEAYSSQWRRRAGEIVGKPDSGAVPEEDWDVSDASTAEWESGGI